MEEFNPRLADVIKRRWKGLEDDERDVVVSWLIGFSPTAVVRAMDYAETLRDAVFRDLAE